MTQNTDWQSEARRMVGVTPWFAAIGGEVLSAKAGQAKARINWREDLIGDPQTGVIHGGVITSLLDQLCGAAVMSALGQPMPIATLDLRIDYLKPATRGMAIVAEAECLKVTHEIAFVRGSAHNEADQDVIALCTAAFMLTRPEGRTS
ncbi:MAG: PaaI family thioesterase [Alphaproteobacteria bacterium]|nr:PaaI family thioesterase [Alphaproteobacteria bacterium]